MSRKPPQMIRILPWAFGGIALAVIIGVTVQYAQDSQQKRSSDEKAAEAQKLQTLKEEEAATRLAATNAALAHEREVAEENSRVSALEADRVRNLGSATNHHLVAILIVNEAGQLNRQVAVAFDSVLKENGVDSTPSLFTSEFVASGNFSDVFGGGKAPIEKLQIARYANTLLLGRQKVTYVTNAELGNLVTATMNLAFVTIPLDNGPQEYATNFTTLGMELGSQTSARSKSEDSLIQEIRKQIAPLISKLKAKAKN